MTDEHGWIERKKRTGGNHEIVIYAFTLTSNEEIKYTFCWCDSQGNVGGPTKCLRQISATDQKSDVGRLGTTLLISIIGVNDSFTALY